MEWEAVDPAGFEPAPLSWTGLRATNYTTGPEIRLEAPVVVDKTARSLILCRVPFRNRLVMHVRALRGVGVVLGWFFHDLHFETHGEILRRIAGSIVAGLIAQSAMHYVFSWHD
jgi:hypothetical protein